MLSYGQAERRLRVMAAPGGSQTSLDGTLIKQHAGPVTVQRRVVVDVPGKFFPGLEPAEQRQFYPGVAFEFAERHSFSRHLKAWGAAHHRAGHPLRVPL